MALSRKFTFIVKKPYVYNKTGIDFNFGRHEDLSNLKSDIRLDLVASVISLYQVDILMSTSLKSIIV